jgi:hypothetical protein
MDKITWDEAWDGVKGKDGNLYRCRIEDHGYGDRVTIQQKVASVVGRP